MTARPERIQAARVAEITGWGEWFEPVPELLARIEALKDPASPARAERR